MVFVDYDSTFGGHRFCEDGVDEPDYDRADTWFFFVGGPDNSNVNGTQAALTAGVGEEEEKTLSPTSVLVDPHACLEPAQQSGDWGALALCYMAMAKDRDPSLRPARKDLVAQNSVGFPAPITLSPILFSVEGSASLLQIVTPFPLY